MNIFGRLLALTLNALVAAVIATLVLTTGADAQKVKSFKERAGGTTSDVGNRCPGGTFASCQKFITRQGTSARGASEHCSRTCPKK